MLRQAFLATFLALGSLAISADKASALVLTVRGNQYDVTTFQGSYNNDTSKFNTSPSGVMPWWGDAALADEFMQLLNDDFGYNNPSSVGPYFAYGTEFLPGIPDLGVPDETIGNASMMNSYGVGFRNGFTLGQTYIFAQAQQVQSVPAPLPIFGVAAAFSCAQRFRRSSQKLSKLAKKNNWLMISRI